MIQRFLNTLSTILLLGVCSLTYAQAGEEGIAFRKGNFEQVLQESARSGKLVFIDCYTSWCGPCKWMEKNIFVNDTAADFYNARFVNYKIDMEKGEGPALRQRYHVQVFPTYLFLDSKGNLIHKATSRMELSEFIAEGRKALDPKASFSALEKAFNNGDRSHTLLLNYAVALQRTDRAKGDSVRALLVSGLTDADYATATGWEVIRQFAWDENEGPGKYFTAHQSDFAARYPSAEVQKVAERLTSSTLYAMIRRNDSTGFFRRLAPWEQSSDPAFHKKALLMKADFYLSTGKIPEYIAVTNEGLKGVLKTDDMQLSFLARRCEYQAKGNRDALRQAYRMAKQAVVINGDEYGNQSTLAKICQTLGYREEALQAAEKTYALSLKETSKIQGLAKKMLDEIKAM